MQINDLIHSFGQVKFLNVQFKLLILKTIKIQKIIQQKVLKLIQIADFFGLIHHFLQIRGRIILYFIDNHICTWPNRLDMSPLLMADILET